MASLQKPTFREKVFLTPMDILKALKDPNTEIYKKYYGSVKNIAEEEVLFYKCLEIYIIESECLKEKQRREELQDFSLYNKQQQELNQYLLNIEEAKGEEIREKLAENAEVSYSSYAEKREELYKQRDVLIGQVQAAKEDYLQAKAEFEKAADVIDRAQEKVIAELTEELAQHGATDEQLERVANSQQSIKQIYKMTDGGVGVTNENVETAFDMKLALALLGGKGRPISIERIRKQKELLDVILNHTKKTNITDFLAEGEKQKQAKKEFDSKKEEYDSVQEKIDKFDKLEASTYEQTSKKIA